MSASPPPRHRRPRPGAAPRGRATSPRRSAASCTPRPAAPSCWWPPRSPRCCGRTSRRAPTRRSGRRGSRSRSATTTLATDLRGWVNEGLMTLFFLVVGLEAKRELDLGELRERTRLAIPVVACLGGMVTAAAHLPGDQRRRRRRRGLGRRRLDRHRARARRAGAGHARARDPPARVPAHARRDRRPRRAAGHRARLHARTSRSSRSSSRSALFGVLGALRWAGSWRGPAAVLVGRRRSGSRCSSRASTR